ncbi:MAG: hydrogenase, partial [Desulfatirhabdiaceae bacterium]
MINILKNRFEQGCRTSTYPKTPVQLPTRYRGRPVINPNASSELARQCAAACPQNAIDAENKTIDMGRCVFCGTCQRISDGQFVTFTQDFALSVSEKEHLITRGTLPDLAHHARQHFKKLFGRSLQLRQVSA